MAKNLKQKAASGMIWTALQKYSTMIIHFISGIILARLLTPFDYGCIGMLMIFMVLAEAFIDGGFGSALIQKKRPTQEDYSTIFWFNVGMSVLLYAIIYVSAPAIARFYNIPLLCDVLRVQGLILFIYALNVIQKNQLKKKLNFKVLSIVTITTALITLVVTVFMAYKGFGVWALVASNLISAAIPAFVFWFFIKWRPIWTFSWQSFKELFGFGFYMFLTHLANRFAQQLQGLLIGKFYNASTMGYYSKAAGTEKLASLSISVVMTQVTYPLYAEVQDDKEKLSNMIRRITMTLSYVTFPLMFILLLCAKPIFVLLYSDRWLQSVPYFQILCIAGLAGCLQSVNLQSIAAIGKSKEMFFWTMFKRIVGIGIVVSGLVCFGMKGLLAGVVFNYWFSWFVNISLVSKYIGYKWYNQILDILPVTIVSLLAAFVSFGVGFLLNLDMYPDGIVKLAVYVILYISWSLVFKPEAYSYFLTIIPSKFKIWKKKD
ncbi:lipopolysaccharide biosynthesis protein [Prevotella sp. E9-3]|uniref:lipopolysaccharide biosynthesis protein n=1 Tax=Prevotella sp. E9-3 TaxID=2913621 RepID=UPI001EDBA610|nr:lipopolysaccharide biosynthesis protein [Prevotella sp. E9-3]UKK49486.1 lipopolysaccharide biosynthesis protein [Prevotella sp. E9-3]